ncbi:putative peptidoglycan binding protein [Azospirillum brasilense]|uniref:Putative peptidoglycan binding protein n=1 Tax=Azospirillum brasilense TaxID=192 RepID=A0A560BUS7_AZOBR|nr:peptidoglycan-binding domain-containing protein [Azospirillum brasilense]TWA76358.1 putative peptidoglycan binding protein [Azospirillum brasilense]
MTGGSHRARRAVALAVVVPVLAAGLLAGAPARAQSTADIQWAQTILKDKGYNIGGRANGQMHAETKAALGKYQAAHGLPVTNQLDKATIAKMMGEREGKAPATVGNLAQQKVGGGGPGQAPREPQREVVPRAAPTQRIDGGTGSVGGGAQFSAGPPATSSSSGSHSSGGPSGAPTSTSSATASLSGQGPVPQAAPRASVTATTPSGQPVAVAEPAADSGSMLPGWAANGARYGVMGVIGATVLGIGFAWWRSGRANASRPAPRDDGPRGQRREPSFGSGRRREELTTGALPPLTSGGRGRR